MSDKATWVDPVYAALKVVTLDSKISEYLKLRDPESYNKVEKAVALIEKGGAYYIRVKS